MIGAAELLIGDAYASIGTQKIFRSMRSIPISAKRPDHSEGIPIST